MQTFKNANFIRRDYECTNVVCCTAPCIEDARTASPNANWIPCDESEPDARKMQKLWRQGSVQFLGWL